MMTIDNTSTRSHHVDEGDDQPGADHLGTDHLGTDRYELLYPSPVGDLVLRADDHTLTYLYLPGDQPDSSVVCRRDELPDHLVDAVTQLGEYFDGDRTEFDLPLAPAGTPFQRSVWFALADIPYGETISYAELARRVGRPSGVSGGGTGQRG